MTSYLAAVNPYWGKEFGSFFLLFFQRLVEMITGKISLEELASDEVQIFVLGLVGCASALIGSFLVLRKMVMLANSLSHTILLGIVIAYIILIPVASSALIETQGISLQALLIASLLTALLTTLLTQGLTHLMKLQEDASIGLVFTTLFALGVVLVTIFTRNTHIGAEAVMGNADALHIHDLKLIFIIALSDLLLIILLFKEFQLTTFDPGLARSLKVSPTLFSYLLMVMTSATVIGAFRAVGVLLVLAYLVGPVLTARLLTNHLKTMIALSVLIGFVCSLCAVALARHFLSVYHVPLSTSGLVVTLIGFVYLLAVLFAPQKGLVVRKARR
jgi:manganese/zinc/iron transport system permease protein